MCWKRTLSKMGLRKTGQGMLFKDYKLNTTSLRTVEDSRKSVETFLYTSGRSCWKSRVPASSSNSWDGMESVTEQAGLEEDTMTLHPTCALGRKHCSAVSNGAGAERREDSWILHVKASKAYRAHTAGGRQGPEMRFYWKSSPGSPPTQGPWDKCFWLKTENKEIQTEKTRRDRSTQKKKRQLGSGGAHL